MAFKITIKNGDIVKRHAKQFKSNITKELKKAVLTTMIKIEGDAKPKAPILSGTLRRSITHSQPSVVGDSVRGRVGSKLQYAPYQELGTSRGIRPKYFIRNAINDNIEFFRRQVQKALESATNRL